MSLSPEAKLRRRSWIGASESAAILGVSHFEGATASRVFWSKRPDLLGECEPTDDPTRNMEDGNWLEPIIIERGVRSLGAITVETQVEIVSAEYPFLGCTLDARGPLTRIVEVSGRFIGYEDCPPEFCLEAKYSTSAEGWGEDDTDNIPTGYLIQCQHQMLVSGLPRCYLFAAIIGFRGIRFARFIIDANADLQASILEKCRAFWFNHVVPGIPPDDAPPPMEIINGVVRPAGKRVELDATAGRIAERWEAIKKSVSEMEKQRDAMKAELLAALGDAEIGALPDGRFLTYRAQSANRIDAELLRSRYPDVAREVTRASENRVARIVKTLKEK